MKRLKGPELKMPDVKVPPFLADVYYDMRDRRLLPFVALVVVAIAAVPFLLADSREPLPSADSLVQSPAEVAELEGVETSDLTVVQAKPGLRDYRKRLRGRTASNPFKQQYTGVPQTSQLESSGSGGGAAESAATQGGTTEVEETSAPAPSPTPEGGGSTGGDGSGGGGGATGDDGSTGGGGSTGADAPPPGTPGVRYYAFRPDLRFGVAGSDDLNLYKGVSMGKLLPEKKPVVAFVGVSDDGKRVGFDVSPEVLLVEGPGHCIGGQRSCDLLTLKAGQAVTLVTGKPNRNFRLDVLKVDFVEVEGPDKARSSGTSQGSSVGLMVVGQFEMTPNRP